MYENRLVKEPSSLIRKIARDALKGRWKDIVIGVFIYLVLTSFVSTVFDTIFPMYQTMEIYGQHYTYNASFVGSLYGVILSGAFSYGLALFVLTFFRTKRANRTLLFEGFSIIGKTILLNILMSLIIGIGLVLLIVPGVIAALRLSQSFYILADHPEYGVTQCLKESNARMKGNCGKLFCLYFSFFGWMLLAGLAETGLSYTGGGVIGTLISTLIALVPLAILITYVFTSTTVFYELLMGNLAVVNRSSAYDAQPSEPVHMVNADYQVHEEEPEETPYVAPEERETYDYAPKTEESFGAPNDDDFGAPKKEEDDF